jgi:hypothetical protein
MRHIAIFLLLTTSIARAQQPPACAAADDEPGCTSVTVVPPPGVVVPPPPAPPPQLILPAPGTALGDGWTLTRDPNGLMYRERSVTSRKVGLWISGLSVFATLYLIGGVVTSVDDNLGSVKGIGFLPVIGAFVAGGKTGQGSYLDHEFLEGSYIVYGLIQAAGFAMLVAGASLRKTHTERQPVVIVPGVLHSGVGVNAVIRF